MLTKPLSSLNYLIASSICFIMNMGKGQVSLCACVLRFGRCSARPCVAKCAGLCPGALPGRSWDESVTSGGAVKLRFSDSVLPRLLV